MTAAASRVALLLLTIGTANACAKERNNTASQGLVVTGTQWAGNTAWVCWETQGFSEQKEQIKQHVEGQFNNRSNLKFFGFGDCASQEKRQIRISIEQLKPNLLGSSRIGNTSDPAVISQWINDQNEIFKPSMLLSKDLFTPAKHRSMLNVALHEFGHAAGLLHEQARTDVSAACRKRLGDANVASEVADKLAMGKLGLQVVRTTNSFDELSVMSYCHIYDLEGRGIVASLSDGDIASLAALYGSGSNPQTPASPPPASTPETSQTPTPTPSPAPTHVAQPDDEKLPPSKGWWKTSEGVKYFFTGAENGSSFCRKSAGNAALPLLGVFDPSKNMNESSIPDCGADAEPPTIPASAGWWRDGVGRVYFFNGTENGSRFCRSVSDVSPEQILGAVNPVIGVDEMSPCS